MLHKGPRGTRERIASHRSVRPDPHATGDLLILSISFSSIHDYDRVARFAAITKFIYRKKHLPRFIIKIFVK